MKIQGSHKNGFQCNISKQSSRSCKDTETVDGSTDWQTPGLWTHRYCSRNVQMTESVKDRQWNNNFILHVILIMLIMLMLLVYDLSYREVKGVGLELQARWLPSPWLSRRLCFNTGKHDSTGYFQTGTGTISSRVCGDSKIIFLIRSGDKTGTSSQSTIFSSGFCAWTQAEHNHNVMTRHGYKFSSNWFAETYIASLCFGDWAVGP